jgi:transcriptional regulator with XRE-family HTH domain
MSTFDKLIIERKRLSVKQKDIAKHLGCTAATLNRYEKGNRDISSAMVDKYADYLGYELKLMIK